MNVVITFINTVYLILALLQLFIAPRIGPNPYFGLKIGYTFSSREVWEKSNRFVGALTLIHAISLTPFSFLSFSYFIYYLFAFIVPTLFISIAGVVYAAHKLEELNVIEKESAVPIKPFEAGFLWKHLGLILFFILLFIMLATYNSLPETIAVHFDLNGKPNGWASKGDFFLLYTIFALIYLSFVYLIIYLGKRYPIIVHSGKMKIGRDTVFKSSILAMNLVLLILIVVYIGIYITNVRHSSTIINLVVILSILLAFAPIGYIIYRWRKFKKEGNNMKMLKCPKCGHVFKAPKMDRKSIGYGFTLPGLGVIGCPKCGYTAPRREFEEVKE